MDKNLNKKPPAVIIGLCVHGLTLAKALAKEGIEVHAVESKTKLAGVKTRYAKVHIVEDVNGPGLIQTLCDLQQSVHFNDKPILFLTNDNMVYQVANNWHKLENIFRLSWANCRNTVKDLLFKTNLQKYCDRSGLLYPKSWILNSVYEISKMPSYFTFPILAKPVKPLLSFKAKLLKSYTELFQLVQMHQQSLPFLIQEWIPGDVSQLIFCAVYLQDDKILLHNEGHKLGAYPTGLGVGNAIAPLVDKNLYEQTFKFFTGLNLSGNYSLEMKRDPNGNLWVIEPTVGRTEYLLGFHIANGMNFPLIEYCSQMGMQIPKQMRRDNTIWIDIERGPLDFLSLLKRNKIFRNNQHVVFTYFDICDLRPFLAVIFIIVKQFSVALKKRLFNILAPIK